MQAPQGCPGCPNAYYAHAYLPLNGAACTEHGAAASLVLDAPVLMEVKA